MNTCLLKSALRWLSLVFLFPALVYAENASFSSYHFSGSGNCTRCHNGMTDPQGHDRSIETAWSSTMMANATKDPFWRAKVRSELNRNPQLASVINDKCTKCHAPMANKEAHYYGDTIEIFGNGFLNPINSHYDEAMNGVSCTLCHQIKDNGLLGTLEGMSGRYEIDDSRTLYGQFSDVATRPMINNVNYTIVYSPHVSDSKMCATCHNLKTPFVDENGNVLSTTLESEFPEQMPYSEWEHSSYVSSQSCQDCHMKHVDGVSIAVNPWWANTPRDGFAHHMFVGGNKLILDILDTNRTALGVTANNFAATLAATDEILASAATLEVVEQSLADNTLEVSLKINSTTGHKLPTSYPSRRVFIHLKVLDDGGNTVFESGKPYADGSIEGADADPDGTTFEPHYDLITSADQVQIYEAVMGDNLGAVTYTLLRGMTYHKDNRILPTGFDKTTAHSDIQVHGGAANDSDFIGGSDTITYQISGLSGQNYTVEAALLYQTLSYAFAQDLFTDPSTEAADFEIMFNASNMKTSQIAVLSLKIGTPPTPACDDGIDNDGDSLIDLADPGCADAQDDDEYNAPAQQITLFSDGFESGMGAWTVSGSGATWYAHTKDPYAGSYSAYVKKPGVNKPTYMETSFNASGSSSVTFSYQRRLKGLDSADDFSAEYFDGSWHFVEHLGSGRENGGYVAKSFSIPSNASKVRFMCEAGATRERCFVDEVMIIASY
jgi:hypothetical protein